MMTAEHAALAATGSETTQHDAAQYRPFRVRGTSERYEDTRYAKKNGVQYMYRVVSEVEVFLI